MGYNSVSPLTRTQPYNNKMLAGGGGGTGLGAYLTPLVETGVLETPGSAMANTIIANTPGHLFDMVVNNNAVPSAPYADLEQGTPAYNTALTQVATIKAASAALGRPYKVAAITAIHGETDNRYFYLPGPIAPNSPIYDTDLATYESNLVTWQANYEADIRAITGQTGTIPLFTDQLSSFFSSFGNTKTSSVPMAQLAAAEHNPGKIYMVTPKYFFRYSDLHHMTAASYRWLGEYYGKVIKKVVVDHQDWKPLSPTSITRAGNVIYAVFHVPSGRLVFDVTNELARSNKGFEYADNTNSAYITGVQILGLDTVKVTLSRTPTGANQRLRYAFTGVIGAMPGAMVLGAAGGNLRDTDPYPSLYGNTLYNWCVQFDKPITSCPPVADPIAGSATVCEGGTTTLSNTSPGGVWSSSGVNARVSALGVVTGITVGTEVITYRITNSCGTAFATKTIAVTTAPGAGVLTGASTVCVSSAITLTPSVPGGTWSATNANAVVFSGIVRGMRPGIDTIMYKITSSCGVSTVTKTIIVEPLPTIGPITGPSSVCVGDNITLTDTTTGGVWTCTNPRATVTGGVVTGITSGADTVVYTLTTGCGIVTITKRIMVDAAPGSVTLTGSGNVCLGASTSLTPSASGGIWSASNTNATVYGGVVRGYRAGTDTITYSLTNSCGTSVATKTINIDPLPNAGVITGPASVCTGDTIVLTDTAAGGLWSAAGVYCTLLGNNVIGRAAGAETITYTVTNICGIATATKRITVNIAPGTVTLSGAANVCVGTATAFTASAPGGAWSVATGNASVVSGIVRGVRAGTDTIQYTITNGCGTATAKRAIAVYPQPNAGYISGPSSVCVGDTITLVDTTTGGLWNAPGVYCQMVGTKIVGRSAGSEVISYTVVNSCGTATATKLITVLAATNAGAIYGPEKLCVGATIQYAHSIGGGAWSVTNDVATMSGGGFLTGVRKGTDTIRYTISGVCGLAIATLPVSVAEAPNAGAITGPSCVIIGSSIKLTDTVPGGVWSVANASASVTADGIVTGLFYGRNLIKYTVTNDCGAVMVGVPVDVENPLSPIVGEKDMCVGHIATFAQSMAGGVWSSSAPNVATVGSANGKVAGIAAGSAIITYTTPCGIVTTTVNIGELPPITGVSSIFPGKSTTLKPPVNGGWWTSSNTAVATITQTGLLTGVASGTAIITYELHIGCSSFLPVTIEKFITPPTPPTPQNMKLSVYPNPNTGDFVLGGTLNSNNSMDAHIHLVNTTGQIIYARTTLVFTNQINEHFYLNEQLPAGMYFLILETEKQREVFRFEVHHH